MDVIATRNLTKRYGRHLALDGLSLSVHPGTVYGFLGPNGAGKTTAIRLILALLRPTAGSVSLFGKDAWQHGPALRLDIGYLPGDLRLYPWMNVRNGLRIIGQTRGCDLTSAGLALANDLGLDCDVGVRDMSRGMRQKLGLILALAHRPKLLILDEPTSALDPLMQRWLYRHLRQRAVEGATVFFSSHSLSEVEELCDRVAILRGGHLVAEESVAAMRQRAGRQVTLRWRDHKIAADTKAPAFLRVEERVGRDWSCMLAGPVSALIEWVAQKPLDDITINPPDLDAVFRHFYDTGKDEV